MNNTEKKINSIIEDEDHQRFNNSYSWEGYNATPMISRDLYDLLINYQQSVRDDMSLLVDN
jgi:hypothetical protein